MLYSKVVGARKNYRHTLYIYKKKKRSCETTNYVKHYTKNATMVIFKVRHAIEKKKTIIRRYQLNKLTYFLEKIYVFMAFSYRYFAR